MIYLIGIAGLLWILYRNGMWRTVLFLGISALAVALITMSFAFGGLLTFIFYPEVVKQWTLLPSLMDAWMLSHETFGAMLVIPLIFVVDCVRWIFHISIFQSNWILWVTMLSGLIFAINAYAAWVGALDIATETNIMTGWLKSRSAAPAKPVRKNGYDEAGHFIGFDYDPEVGNIKY